MRIDDSGENLSRNSWLHCLRSEASTTSRICRLRSAQRWATARPASIVLPRPTSSASKAPFEREDVPGGECDVYLRWVEVDARRRQRLRQRVHAEPFKGDAMGKVQALVRSVMHRRMIGGSPFALNTAYAAVDRGDDRDHFAIVMDTVCPTRARILSSRRLWARAPSPPAVA